jgi:1-acyl-sn-glycerol-3-phosphate acyltransferase
MIIGGSKKEVIENIKLNIKNNELNKKAELNDPKISEEESSKLIDKFYKIRKNKLLFNAKNKLAYKTIDKYSKPISDNTEIVGLENLKNINSGAIITTNHFNPLDSIGIRKMILERFHKNPYIVIQDTNLAMPDMLGFLFNYLNTIPISKSPNYIIKGFIPKLKDILDKKNYVLIYPEEEMWFNYRKPRPCKRGAYQFAAEANVPIISCFVEIKDLDKDDNEEFKEVKYIVHILKPIYPDSNKTVRQNSIDMADIDYKQKVKSYEECYKKKLDYTFNYQDIAGYKKE